MKTFKTNCYECGVDVVRKKQSKPVKVHFCSMTCKANYQRRAKPVSEKWLRDHYLDKKMNCTEIAHIVNRDPKSVWNWLKDLGIPTRPRGHDWRDKLKIGSGPDNAFYGKKHSKATREKLKEIAIADGRVPFDPKVGSYMKGRKGPNTPRWKGGITPERQSVYSSTEWCNAVKTVWKRDKATCQRCGLRKNEAREVSFDIHHIKGFANVKHRTNPDALVLLCEPCHYWVHSRKNEKGEFIQ